MSVNTDMTEEASGAMSKFTDMTPNSAGTVGPGFLSGGVTKPGRRVAGAGGYSVAVTV